MSYSPAARGTAAGSPHVPPSNRRAWSRPAQPTHRDPLLHSEIPTPSTFVLERGGGSAPPARTPRRGRTTQPQELPRAQPLLIPAFALSLESGLRPSSHYCRWLAGREKGLPLSLSHVDTEEAASLCSRQKDLLVEVSSLNSRALTLSALMQHLLLPFQTLRTSLKTQATAILRGQPNSLKKQKLGTFHWYMFSGLT